MGLIRSAGVWLGLVEDDRYREDEDYLDEAFAVPPARGTSRTADRADPDTRSDIRPGRRRTVRTDYWNGEDEGLDLLHEPDEQSRGRAREQPTTRTPRVDLRVVREQAEARLGERRVPAQEPRTDWPTSPPLLRQPPSAASSTAASTPGSTALSVPAPEGLVPAPQVKLRERAAAADDRLARGGEITTLHPTGYGDARAVGERYRDGFPVLMDLTDLPESDAKRLVDFAAGLAFGLRGKIERVTNRVFLLTPRNMRVTDDEMRRLTDPGF